MSLKVQGQDWCNRLCLILIMVRMVVNLSFTSAFLTLWPSLGWNGYLKTCLGSVGVQIGTKNKSLAGLRLAYLVWGIDQSNKELSY